MLSSMLPQHFQNQQTPINQSARQLPQNYGMGYQAQARGQHVDYTMLQPTASNHQQNSGYIAVGPSPGNTSMQIPGMASVARSNYAYGQNLQPLQCQTVPNSSRSQNQTLHWQNNSTNHRVQQQVMQSQPLVQQSLRQLGIPAVSAQPVPSSTMRTNASNPRPSSAQIIRHQLQNHSAMSQSMNLASPTYGYQRSVSVTQQPAARPNPGMAQMPAGGMFRQQASDIQAPVVLRSQSYTQPSSSEIIERDRVRIRFDQNKQAPVPAPAPVVRQSVPAAASTAASPGASSMRKRSTSGYSDSSSNKDDGAPEKTKMKLELDDETRVVIDDDLEIVGCKQAEVMSHSRADCPIHKFVRFDSVTSPCNPANEKYCSKCFCYVCDTLASQCKLWTDKSCAHSNAHAKASCWKARRNMKKSPLMKSLTAEEVTPEISVAGDKSIQFIIKIREAYITYRAGIPCDFHQVPCDCNCHRDDKLKPEGCVSCKAVHDLRKRFNYDPVRQVIYSLLEEIESDYKNKPYSALVLYEASLSELCSHRPADFNHVTRMPSNPDVSCQCTTPQIMDEKIEPALIRLLTLHEIDKAFKDKFYTCVNNSIQPLQLKDVMKRFLTMRHWDDLLLRAVLSGQNTSGRSRSNDMLKESMAVVEMRVTKLDRENRYYAIIRYLKTVKIFKAPKLHNGLPVALVIEKWLLLYTAKLGRFRDVCIKMLESHSLLASLPVDYTLELLTLLSGKNLPPNTQLASSFENGTTSYTITGANQTALCLVTLVYMESNPVAMDDIRCYLWFCKWVNERAAPQNPPLVAKWINEATSLVKVGQKVPTLADAVRLQQCTQNCLPLDHQVSLFVASLLVLRYVTKVAASFDRIEEFAATFKNNEWVLFYLFSQQALLTSGNRFVVTWLAKYAGAASSNVTHFSQESLALLIQKASPGDVFPFLKSVLTDDWTKYTKPAVFASVKIAAKFATRLINEAEYPDEVGAFLSDVLFSQILSMQLNHERDLVLFCEVIGRASCLCGSVSELDRYKQLFPREHWPAKCQEILTQLGPRFSRGHMKPEEVVLYLRYAVTHGHTNSVNMIFARFTEKHECGSGATGLVMQEVIQILDSRDKHVMNKLVLMDAYTKLCSHETLSWLICAKCSAQMPDGWVNVWLALERNGMNKFLRDLVKQMLHQFSSWMKELCKLKDDDAKRLLTCLDIFVRNVVKTLAQCHFPLDEVKNMLLETRHVIASPQLRSDYAKIIHSSIPTEKPQPPAPAPAPTPSTPANHTVPSTDQTQPTPAAQPVTKAPVTSPKPPPAVPNPPTGNSTPKSDEIRSPPPPRTQTSPKGLLLSPTAPGAAGPGPLSPSVCPKCGDPMANSFKCTKCHARRNRDIKCPKCGEVNRDLKGYSCRFCYACLLTELTSGDSGTTADPKSPTVSQQQQPPDAAAAAAAERKKAKKLKKKKRLEKRASRDLKSPQRVTPNSNSSSDPGSTASESADGKKHPTKIVLQKMKPQDQGGANHKNDFQVKSSTWSKEPESSAPLPCPPAPSGSLKIRFRPKSAEKPLEAPTKKRVITSEPLTRQENLSDSDDSDAGDFKDSTNFYSQMRKPGRRKWNSGDLTPVSPRARNHSSGPEKPSSTFPARSPTHGESSKAAAGPKIPPLILKRKSEDAVRSPERKRAKVEHQAPKRVPSMSKKQRDILQRMKTGAKPKPAPSGPKPAPTPKSPPRSAEWEVTRRRKPGPASRTSYYEINPSWRIPKYLKLPYTLDLPKVCRVHLSPYPPKIMRLIHEHQPNLKLNSLYA